jgi:two-component system response regulator HydG
MAGTPSLAPASQPLSRLSPPADIEQDPVAEYFEGSPALRQLREQVQRVAPQNTTILLTGATGTGKTRLARLIHQMSPRSAEPFLVVDCGALAASLIESEMFGHAKGAFTGADRERVGKFAAAGRGTLLLDEINSLPLPLQSKLLRVIEERVFEPVGSNRSQALQARIIAVSNAALDEEVQTGRFRADLYFRLNVVGFALPPLAERRASILHLCRKVFAEFAGRNRPDVEGLSPEALVILQEYDWPGNIRELRNVIERAIALCPGPRVEASDLPEMVRAKVAATNQALGIVLPPQPRDLGSLTLAESNDAAEMLRIKEALVRHRNNRLRAAGELGISRMGLYKKLHKYGMMQASPLLPRRDMVSMTG